MVSAVLQILLMTPQLIHIVLLLLSLRAAAFESQCVSSFKENAALFDACLTEPCFMFREEEPYVFVDNNMNGLPFPCADHKRKSPHLHGAFFDTIRNMSTLNNAYCVFAGRHCTFNGMVGFINSSAARTEHQWIAGGILFVLKKRILPGVIPSTSILEDYLHIVGPGQDREPLGAAWDLVVAPFSGEAWITIGFVVLLFLIVRVLMIHMFGGAKKASSFLRGLILCSFQTDISARSQAMQKDDDEWWQLLDHHWRLAFVFFTAAILLLYEVALAVIAFESIQVRPLVNLNATKFALINDTTQEYFFEKLSGNDGKHTTFNTESKVYNALRNSSNELEYTVSYGIDNRWQFTNDPKLCEDLRLYDSVPSSLVKGRQPPPISGVWFFSATIPEEKRMSINKGILKLKEQGRILEFVDRSIGNEKLSNDCKPQRNQISGNILFLLVLFPLGYLLAICFSIAVAKINSVLDKLRADSADASGSGILLSEPSSGSSDEAGSMGATRNKGELSETRRRVIPCGV